jgi:pimeloyl-ACP methyl ester carboxylesterase
MGHMLDEFRMEEVDTGASTIFLGRSGTGPPVLLLHGFPQTHLTWCRVAPLLARRFTVVCADLRGYGHSSCPPSTRDHAPYAKRALAQDMVIVRSALGICAFQSLGTIVAPALPTAWRSTILIVSNGLGCLISFRARRLGTARMHGSRLATGPGRCLPNQSLYRTDFGSVCRSRR